MTNVRPLPVEIGDITPAWLSAALGSPVSAAKVVDVNNGTCTKIRIALETDDPDTPETVILKGGFEPHSRMMDYMHANEVHAYADVAPHSPLRQPRTWFAGFDADAKQGIVIMEDLVARGVTFLHPQQPRPPEEVARRLEMLAKHHAMTLGRPEDMAPDGRFAWAGDLIDGFYRYGETILTPPVWEGFVNSAFTGSTGFSIRSASSRASARRCRARCCTAIPTLATSTSIPTANRASSTASRIWARSWPKSPIT